MLIAARMTAVGHGLLASVTSVAGSGSLSQADVADIADTKPSLNHLPQSSNAASR